MPWYLNCDGPDPVTPKYGARVTPNSANPSWDDGFQWEGKIRLNDLTSGPFEGVLFTWGQRQYEGSTTATEFQWSLNVYRGFMAPDDEWNMRVVTTEFGTGPGDPSGEVGGVPITLGDWTWIRVTYIGDDGAGNRETTVEYSTDSTDDPDSVTWTTVGTDTVSGTLVPGSTDPPPAICVGQVQESGLSITFDAKVMRVHSDPLGSPVVEAYPRWVDQAESEFIDSVGLRWEGWRQPWSPYGGIVSESTDSPDESPCAYLRVGSNSDTPLDFITTYNVLSPDDTDFDWTDGFEITARIRVPFYGSGPSSPQLLNEVPYSTLKLASQINDDTDWSFVLALTGSPTANYSAHLMATTDGTMSGVFSNYADTIEIDWDVWYWVRIAYFPGHTSSSSLYVSQYSADQTSDPLSVGWESTHEDAGDVDIANSSGPLVIGSPIPFSGSVEEMESTHRFDIQYFSLVKNIASSPDPIADSRFNEQPESWPMMPFTDSEGRDWDITGDPELALCPVRIYVFSPIGSAALAYGPLGVDPGNVMYTPGGEWPPEWGPEPLDTVFQAIVDAVVVDYDDFEDRTPIPGGFAHEWQEPMQEPGRGSVTFTYNDSDILDLLEPIDPLVENSPAILTQKLIMFRLYGQAALTMRPEQVLQGFLTSQDEYTNDIKVSGTQHLALFDEAVIYPTLGPGTIPVEDDRPFNWTAPFPTYEAGAWGFARNLARWIDETPGWSRPEPEPARIPEAWPESAQNVFWIGPQVGTSRNAPAGTCYFRKAFEVPAGVQQIGFFFAADNRGDLYLDGQLIGSSESYWDTSAAYINISPGTHYLAAEVTNYPMLPPDGGSTAASPFYHTVVPGDTLWGLASRYYGSGAQWRAIYEANAAEIQSEATARGLWNPSDPGHWIFPGQVFTIPGLGSGPVDIINPIGLIVVGYMTLNGQLVMDAVDGPIVQTDSSWNIVEYPPDPPGITVGRVIRVVVEEARHRGAIPGITLNFNDVTDSAGLPWPLVSDISTKVGNDYLTFFVKELSETYVDLWMHPGGKILSAWNKGGRGQVLDIEYSGPENGDQATSSIRDLTITRHL